MQNTLETGFTAGTIQVKTTEKFSKSFRTDAKEVKCTKFMKYFHTSVDIRVLSPEICGTILQGISYECIPSK